MGLSLSSFPWSGVTSTDHWYLTSAPFYPPYILTDSTRLTRAERKKDQVCSPAQYEKVFQRIRALPPTVEHLVVQLGVLIWKRFNTQDSLSRSIQVSPSPTHAWYSWRRRSNLNLTLLLLLVGMGPWVSRDLSISLIMKLSCWMTLCVDYPAFVHTPRWHCVTLRQNDHWTARNHKVCNLFTLLVFGAYLFAWRHRKNATGSSSNCRYSLARNGYESHLSLGTCIVLLWVC